MVGAVHAQSFSGSVDIRTKEWQDNQTIDVDTFSGSVQLHVPDRAYGTVHFNSFSGRLSAELPFVQHEQPAIVHGPAGLARRRGRRQLAAQDLQWKRRD